MHAMATNALSPTGRLSLAYLSLTEINDKTVARFSEQCRELDVLSCAWFLDRRHRSEGHESGEGYWPGLQLSRRAECAGDEWRNRSGDEADMSREAGQLGVGQALRDEQQCDGCGRDEIPPGGGRQPRQRMVTGRRGA